MALWQSLNTLSKNFDDPASIEARYAVREILALRQKIAELAKKQDETKCLLIDCYSAIKKKNNRIEKLEESIGWLANEPWYIGITQEDAKEIALALANVIGDAEPKPLSNRAMLKWPVSARRAVMERDVAAGELRAKIAALEAERDDFDAELKDAR